MWLQARMYMLVGLMFVILYGFLLFVGAAVGYSGQSFVNYSVILALGMMFVQYMIGPKMVESSMKVRYITEGENPKLYRMVEEQARLAGLKKTPKVGTCPTPLPNAFAFGKSKGDARVCVTDGIVNLLSENELKAVIGHEISHVKHRDMAIITLLSAVPMIAYYMYMSSRFSGSVGRSNDRNSGGTAIIGIFALVVYFITNLLVMYGSRIREYYADKGSTELGNEPHQLASALYKLTYGTAKTPRSELQRVEGVKAFFVNDPTKAKGDFNELTEVDRDMSGTIDRNELESVRHGGVRVGASASIMELMSTHPNMLKRIKHLSELSK
ncbi:MAG: heat shock protein HtpX [Candidatus Methanofastidiosum methylothiophilum]|uniref:Protease HtpX homolog n=1 Tax=Candidatus Methanofastidiosum methylothiophilum TaxID=1705564 RepID=A0A150JJT3_9EURY|nr:MAG: heat shock protein HtpX [Candidatus Methanofastidiosum methylthiophilus]OQC51973.1 MAG: heat shock protein HtpX [Euryarchaeota archaeon ADurb.Bin023]HNZ60433.1 zinc metalloprotease HtpX [Methanofastidiosum sp.]KYC57320.1 MAG: heat shock protein HtpX [Candidatus Methanofastidiosum methylthiophilus]KYC57497.1 MAG: heat shock protein HtpX [Candidatus Methanofastidiosum methylthiophilus]